MKARHILAASLVAVCTWATVADAQMMGPGTGMPGPGGYFSNPVARSSYMGRIDMRAIASTWLGTLHEALAITPAQEAAWLAFANAVTDQAGDMQDFRTQIVQPGASTATAPQRAALAQQFMAQRLESVGAVASSMAMLYPRLTPAQQAILDAAYASACVPGGLFGS